MLNAEPGGWGFFKDAL